jgi:4-azaleucine resistance transporter AzlC
MSSQPVDATDRLLKRREFLAGVRAELLLIIGVAPFGMIYGAVAVNAGMSVPVTQAMSAVVFAGSAQFATAQLAAGGVPTLVMIMTIFVLNLRHALYSASIAPYTKHLSIWWKAGLSYLLTDEAYAVTILNYERPGDNRFRHWFFLGAGLTLWTFWQASTALGIFLGTVIPTSWSLDFTLALIFIAIVVPLIRDRAALAAAVVAGVVAVLAYPLPYRLGLVIAALGGILTGLLVESRQR